MARYAASQRWNAFLANFRVALLRESFRDAASKGNCRFGAVRDSREACVRDAREVRESRFAQCCSGG
eukprot:3021524-Lingulodinium_polyedra.AAC.1